MDGKKSFIVSKAIYNNNNSPIIIYSVLLPNNSENIC